MIITYALLNNTKVIRLHPVELPTLPQAGWEFVAEGNVYWPQSPFDSAELHLINGKFEWKDPRTLPQARLETWEKVKLWRSKAIDKDLETPHGTFQCREKDRRNISDSVLLANTLGQALLPVAITWTLANNTTVTLNQAQMNTVGLLLGQKIQQAHERSRVLRQAIEARDATLASLRNLTWDT